MSLTFIDTNKLPHEKTPGAGEFTEILNNKLCGAKNVVGTLHWLKSGERFQARSRRRHASAHLFNGRRRDHQTPRPTPPSIP